MPIAADLLSLSDDQLSAVMAASAQLQQPDRPLFLETVAAHLKCVPEGVGDGSVHRVLREVLGDFLRGRALDGTGGRGAAPPVKTRRGPKYAHDRAWICRPGRRRR